jgi:hypothetical protein
MKKPWLVLPLPLATTLYAQDIAGESGDRDRIAQLELVEQ